MVFVFSQFQMIALLAVFGALITKGNKKKQRGILQKNAKKIFVTIVIFTSLISTCVHTTYSVYYGIRWGRG